MINGSVEMAKQVRILYSNPNKWEKEEGFFKTFLSQRSALNINRYDKGESPDYILHISQKRIGLEVTTLVLEKPNKKPSLAAIRGAQDECLKKATTLARQKQLPIINVQVQFRSDHDRIDIDRAARELAEFVEWKISEIDDTKSWPYYESGLLFSRWIIIQLGTVNKRKWLKDYRFERIHINLDEK